MRLPMRAVLLLPLVGLVVTAAAGFQERPVAQVKKFGQIPLGIKSGIPVDLPDLEPDTSDDDDDEEPRTPRYD